MTVRVPVFPDEIDLDTFLEELAKTGVSGRFLEEARPRIARVFTEVAPEHRAECLKAIRITVRTQAETEASFRKSMQQVEQLSFREAELLEKLQELKQSAKIAADAAAAAAFGLFRLSHPPRDVN